MEETAMGNLKSDRESHWSVNVQLSRVFRTYLWLGAEVESTNQASEISNQMQEGASKKSGLFSAIKMWGLIGSTAVLLLCIWETPLT